MPLMFYLLFFRYIGDVTASKLTSSQAPCNFSPWYSWIIAHLALNNNHSRRVPLAKLELLIHPLHLFFLWDSACSIFSFRCSVLQIMFVLFSFLFWLSQIYWPLYCLSVTDLQILISSTFLMFQRLYYAIKTKTHSNWFKV
jgi:hypothetical protein